MISSVLIALASYGFAKGPVSEDPDEVWITRLRKHPLVWAALSQPRVSGASPFILCCPVTSSLPVSLFLSDQGEESATELFDFFAAHVLEPANVDISSAESAGGAQEGVHFTTFRTLGGQSVRLENSELCLSGGGGRDGSGAETSPERRRAQLLGVQEWRYEGTVLQLWRVSRPLLGGLHDPAAAAAAAAAAAGSSATPAPTEAAREFSLQVALLRSYPQADALLCEVDAFVQDVCRLAALSTPAPAPAPAPAGDGDGDAGASSSSPSASAACAPDAHPFSRVQPSFRRSLLGFYRSSLGRLRVAGLHSAEELPLDLILEDYIFSGVGACTYSWLVSQDRWSAWHPRVCELLSQIRTEERGLRQGALAVAERYCSSEQHAAVAQLRAVAAEATPAGKLACLNQVVSLAQRSAASAAEAGAEAETTAGELSTDDLLPILIYIVACAAPAYSDLHADLRFISEYRCAACADPGGSREMALCHFQVVQAWLEDKINCESQ